MLTNPNKELYLNCEKDSGFFMYNLAQSRFKATNRYLSHNRNVPFLLNNMFDTESYKKNRIYNDKLKAIKNEKMKIASLSEQERKDKIDKMRELNRINSLNNTHKRRLRIKLNYKKVTLEDWHNIIDKQNNICSFCKQEFSSNNPATQDHIIPLSVGGKHNKDNIQALHKSCNSKKGTKCMKSA